MLEEAFVNSAAGHELDYDIRAVSLPSFPMSSSSLACWRSPSLADRVVPTSSTPISST
jgi:hypothetical protein